MADPLDELRATRDALPPPPPAMSSYLEKVHVRAATVTDADLGALEAAGLSQDEIFEQTVGVAIAEGLRRLDAARRAIGGMSV